MKLICVDLERGLRDIPRPTVGEQWVLVRLHGDPLGMLKLPRGVETTAADLAERIARQMPLEITRHLLHDALTSGNVGDANMADLTRFTAECPRLRDIVWPHVTVGVCTRNRAAELPECLDALERLDYPPDLLDIVIVDNAPTDGGTREIVESRGARMRYACEPRPGLDWARNRVIREARGDIVAFTDDDVSVESGWVKAIARVFSEEAHAMCVTGLIVPDEIDVESQALFEQYGGFGRGFRRIYAQVDAARGESAARAHGGTGKFGSGANMAFRRELFERVGPFDPALDVGTPTNGGGDLEMFFRVLKHGFMLVYEPAAIVRHRHRRTYEALRTQLANNGIGFYSYLVRTARTYPEEKAHVVRLGAWWLWYWNVRRLLASFVSPRAIPRDLIWAELKGSIAGLRRYDRAQQQAQRVARAHEGAA